MVFSSLLFLFIFLPVFLISYFAFKKRSVRNVILLLFSLAFYSYGEPIYIFVMFFSIIINYLLTIVMVEKNNSKLVFIITLVINLGLLFVFKYYNFFLSNINNIFHLKNTYLNISLPIGISFYTFQILTYVVDVYRKKVDVQTNIIKLGCYISAFPQLIAGPIVKYSTVNEELDNRSENKEDFAIGIRKFIIGLSKKILIANEMAVVADTLLLYNIGEIGFIGVFIGGVAYTLQIYFDFSGYSDMAIGLGRMIGFHYLENFDYPYIAKTVTEFWRRWHISLSSFFKEYVYIPLGGNRCSVPKNILNLMIVWLLTGLWHGASWNFVLWGLYYGILLILEKYVIKDLINKVPDFIKHIITLFIVMVGWLIFYQTDGVSLINTLKALVGFYGFGSLNLLSSLQVFRVKSIITFILAFIFSVPIKMKDGLVKDIILIVLFLLSIVFIVSSSYNPFIYFRF